MVITGASGGVGILAVQLARDAAARVVAVAHRWAHSLLEDLGAEVLIEPDNADSGQVIDADLLFDLVGGDVAQRCVGTLRADGMVVSVVGPDLGAPRGGSSVFFVVEPHPAQLRELAGLVEAGRVRPMVGKVVSLADGPQGLSAKGAGGIPGKVVWEVP